METLEKKDIKTEFIQHLNSDLVKSAYRKKALEQLISANVPNSKSEFWKYTRINKILKNKYTAATNNTFNNEILNNLPLNAEESILVFVNGIFVKEHSKIIDATLDFIPFNDGIVCERYNAFFNKLAQNDKHFFDAINTAFSQSGILLSAPSLLKQNVQVVHIISNNNVFIQPRNLFIIDTGSKINLTEYIVADTSVSNTFINQLTEVVVMPNATFNYFKYQNINTTNYMIDSTYVLQNTGSTFNTNYFSFNAGILRNNCHIQSSGETTHTEVNGITITKNKQHIDQHIFIDHQQPNCTSNQLFKTIAGDKSTAVFNGKVLVRQDAQQINAFQSNANILLNDEANIYAKPELEIYADDVKCSHGSSTGQLDEEALFYLRARGISEQTAKKILIKAFLNDVTENVSNENYQAFLSTQIEHLLQ